MYREYITTGVERNHIISLRVHGDLAGELIPAVDWIEQYALDLHIWAGIKLGQWKRTEDIVYRECQVQGSTRENYCAQCWARHLSADDGTA